MSLDHWATNYFGLGIRKQPNTTVRLIIPITNDHIISSMT